MWRNARRDGRGYRAEEDRFARKEKNFVGKLIRKRWYSCGILSRHCRFRNFINNIFTRLFPRNLSCCLTNRELHRFSVG